MMIFRPHAHCSAAQVGVATSPSVFPKQKFEPYRFGMKCEGAVEVGSGPTVLLIPYEMELDPAKNEPWSWSRARTKELSVHSSAPEAYHIAHSTA